MERCREVAQIARKRLIFIGFRARAVIPGGAWPGLKRPSSGVMPSDAGNPANRLLGSADMTVMPSGAGYVFEDISVGMAADLMKTVMSSDVVGFAQLSGDNNPVHLSAHYAAKTPFKDRIAHGLYTASLISAVLGTKLPGPGAIYLTQSLNFRAPVRIGDVVHAHAEVTQVDATKKRVTLACTCSVDNKVVLDGEAVVMVPGRNDR